MLVPWRYLYTGCCEGENLEQILKNIIEYKKDTEFVMQMFQWDFSDYEDFLKGI